MTFFSTYAALRLTGNAKNRPRVLFPLLKAFGLLVYCAILLPVAMAEFIITRLFIRQTLKPIPAPIQRTRSGYPRRFADHVNDLQEDMK